MFVYEIIKKTIIFDFKILFQDAWKYKDNPNLKFIWYEDLVSNMPKKIKEIAEFTGYSVRNVDFATI